MERLIDDMRIRMRVALVVCLCFLLTSTGWLAWLYHLMELDTSLPSDAITLVAGYALQALGTGGYVFALRRWPNTRQAPLLPSLLFSYVALLVPATLGGVAASLAWGLLSNVICGAIQGHYLCLIADHVPIEHRGAVFGCSYAASTLLSWALTLPAEGSLARGFPCLFLCSLLAVAVLAVAQGLPTWPVPTGRSDEQTGQTATANAMMSLACGIVFMVSAVKTVGYSFPASDIDVGVNIELLRLFYGLGLVVAGCVGDCDRRLVMALCGMALITPFLMLALLGAGVAGAPLWMVAYFLTGFFVVYRVLLMMDLADGQAEVGVAAFGLLFGRLGDAAGSGAYLMLGAVPVALIVLALALFAVAMVIMLRLYQMLYLQTAEVAIAPASSVTHDEWAQFETFAQRYGLTARERDVLRLVLAEKSNSEIAAELVITEATVKYHVGNLLKKTGCKNRLEVLGLYGQMGNEQMSPSAGVVATLHHMDAST